jgi:ATP-dependent Zn protease
MNVERIAYHESGHTIAAITFGLPVVAVTIDGRPHLHRDRFRRERSSATEALIIVCLAGPSAETLFFGPADDGGDRINIDMARRYLCGCFADNQIELQMLRMSQAAERLVTSSRREIEAIAAALMQRGTLTGAEVVDLLASLR